MEENRQMHISGKYCGDECSSEKQEEYPLKRPEAVFYSWSFSRHEGKSRCRRRYLLDQSLSVDNLFVFVLIFKYFKVPVTYQSRVLSYGIVGAIVFRLSLILLGTATIQVVFSFTYLFQPCFSHFVLWPSNFRENQKKKMYSAIHSLPLEGHGGDFHSANLGGDSDCVVMTSDPKPRLRWTVQSESESESASSG
ncbi:hypothetical protein Nepgr_029520 [Nepenthes gracilis]|uniref:Uncharacterized protein n=1 Tax=Nepenthes gracilis TaxID=150966 RepID=A0AAD3TFI2_NEPGR|nr:hypothetical protein Nepgr_029520 [Nepenthes gracilis]